MVRAPVATDRGRARGRARGRGRGRARGRGPSGRAPRRDAGRGFVPLDPRCPALSRIRFFLGKGGTVKCGVRISECGMEDGRKRHELHELSRKEGLIEPSGRQAAKPAPIQMRSAETSASSVEPCGVRIWGIRNWGSGQGWSHRVALGRTRSNQKKVKNDGSGCRSREGREGRGDAKQTWRGESVR